MSTPAPTPNPGDDPYVDVSIVMHDLTDGNPIKAAVDAGKLADVTVHLAVWAQAAVTWAPLTAEHTLGGKDGKHTVYLVGSAGAKSLVNPKQKNQNYTPSDILNTRSSSWTDKNKYCIKALSCVGSKSADGERSIPPEAWPTSFKNELTLPDGSTVAFDNGSGEAWMSTNTVAPVDTRKTWMVAGGATGGGGATPEPSDPHQIKGVNIGTFVVPQRPEQFYTANPLSFTLDTATRQDVKLQGADRTYMAFHKRVYVPIAVLLGAADSSLSMTAEQASTIRAGGNGPVLNFRTGFARKAVLQAGLTVRKETTRQLLSLAPDHPIMLYDGDHVPASGRGIVGTSSFTCGGVAGTNKCCQVAGSAEYNVQVATACAQTAPIGGNADGTVTPEDNAAMFVGGRNQVFEKLRDGVTPAPGLEQRIQATCLNYDNLSGNSGWGCDCALMVDLDGDLSVPLLLSQSQFETDERYLKDLLLIDATNPDAAAHLLVEGEMSTNAVLGGLGGTTDLSSACGTFPSGTCVVKTKGNSLTWLWIVLAIVGAVVVAGAVVAGIYIKRNHGKRAKLPTQ